MGIFDDQLAADAAIFCDPDLFGETAVYISAAGTKTINVQAAREDVQAIAGANLTSKRLRIFIPMSSVPSIDTGADRISIPARQGQPAVEKRQMKIVSQDPGGWTVELQ